MSTETAAVGSAGLPERRRLGDVLVERDLITRDQLDEALEAQRQLAGRVGIFELLPTFEEILRVT